MFVWSVLVFFFFPCCKHVENEHGTFKETSHPMRNKKMLFKICNSSHRFAQFVCTSLGLIRSDGPEILFLVLYSTKYCILVLYISI